MGSFNVRNILTVPGTLWKNPTDLDAGSSGYGTQLGVVRELFLEVDVPYAYILGEEYGGARVDAVRSSEGCAIGGLLQSWDADLLADIFPNTAVGSPSGKRRVVGPGSSLVGALLSSRSFPLLFVPDDVDRHPMFLMRNALPAVEETFRISMRLDEEFGIPVLFYGIRDASNRLFDWGMAHDLAALL